MSFALNYHRWILAEFLPHLGADVAEVGAGVGSFSALLLAEKIERLTSFEPSGNMFPLLQAALAKDPRATAVNDFFGRADAGHRYDSVLYVNVLEHVEDDALELENARRHLKPDGTLLIFVPALAWLYSEFDRRIGHFRRYRKGELVTRVQQAGFDVLHARWFDVAGILPWYLNFVLLKNSMGGASVSAYDRLVVPPMRWLEGLIAPPIGKNVLLVARPKRG